MAAKARRRAVRRERWAQKMKRERAYQPARQRYVRSNRADSREILVVDDGVHQRAVRMSGETRNHADASVAAAVVEPERVAGLATVEHQQRAPVRECRRLRRPD